MKVEYVEMFKPGDRVRHGVHVATVTGFGPNGGVHISWMGNGWADNVPPAELKLESRALYLDPAEIECLEVFADGSVELLGGHSRSVMAKMMLDIAKRAK